MKKEILKEALDEFKEYFKANICYTRDPKIVIDECVLEIYEYCNYNAHIRKHIKNIFKSKGLDAIAKKSGYLLVR